jgi:hypothetical protein
MTAGVAVSMTGWSGRALISSELVTTGGASAAEAAGAAGAVGAVVAAVAVVSGGCTDSFGGVVVGVVISGDGGRAGSGGSDEVSTHDSTSTTAVSPGEPVEDVEVDSVVVEVATVVVVVVVVDVSAGGSVVVVVVAVSAGGSVVVEVVVDTSAGDSVVVVVVVSAGGTVVVVASGAHGIAPFVGSSGAGPLDASAARAMCETSTTVVAVTIPATANTTPATGRAPTWSGMTRRTRARSAGDTRSATFASIMSQRISSRVSPDPVGSVPASVTTPPLGTLWDSFGAREESATTVNVRLSTRRRSQ